MFDLGDLKVELGGAIRSAQLTWQTHGTLNETRDNVIVYPCSYRATHDDLAWLIGPDGVLDPSEWFIVTPDRFGNGCSSSPSNTDDFPAVVTMADNVRAQHRLLTEHFGVTRVAASYGFSMGAGQAYHWAGLYPDFVGCAIVVCGSARTSIHNRGTAHEGDLEAALAGIRARVLLLPSETDPYFRVADGAAELPHLAAGQLAPIPSIWGHRAGSPEGIPAALDFLTREVRAWLAS